MFSVDVVDGNYGRLNWCDKQRKEVECVVCQEKVPSHVLILWEILRDASDGKLTVEEFEASLKYSAEVYSCCPARPLAVLLEWECDDAEFEARVWSVPRKLNANTWPALALFTKALELALPCRVAPWSWVMEGLCVYNRRGRMSITDLLKYAAEFASIVPLRTETNIVPSGVGCASMSSLLERVFYREWLGGDKNEFLRWLCTQGLDPTRSPQPHDLLYLSTVVCDDTPQWRRTLKPLERLDVLCDDGKWVGGHINRVQLNKAREARDQGKACDQGKEGKDDNGEIALAAAQDDDILQVIIGEHHLDWQFPRSSLRLAPFCSHSSRGCSSKQNKAMQYVLLSTVDNDEGGDKVSEGTAATKSIWIKARSAPATLGATPERDASVCAMMAGWTLFLQRRAAWTTCLNPLLPHFLKPCLPLILEYHNALVDPISQSVVNSGSPIAS